jgi:hypothetical protein
MIAEDNEEEIAFATALIDALPSTIRVGAYDFRIEKWSPHAASANRRWGEVSSVEQTIRIQRDMPTRYKAVDTVIHEIMHALYWAVGVDDEDTEERIVSLLSTATASLYRDNSWLIDWIKSAQL